MEKKDLDIHFIFIGAMNAAIGGVIITLFSMLYFKGVTFSYMGHEVQYMGAVTLFSVLMGLYLISTAVTILKRELRTAKRK